MARDELRELADDLYEAAERMPEEARKVVSKGALNIKDDWRDAWSHLNKYGRHLRRTVSYDVTKEAGGDIIAAEIGPVLSRKQGPLGGIIEYGSVNNAPIPGGGPALMKESPRFEDAMGDMAERLLDG